VWRGGAGEVDGGPKEVLTVRSATELFPPNRHFFAPIKALDRPEGRAPSVDVERSAPNELAVRITASTYLHFVHLLVPDEQASFSDNYFDLLPGETREITVRGATDAIDAQSLSVAGR